MTSRTADEALEEYKLKMGGELGTLFHHVLQELCWISSVWDVHEVLFDTPQSVELMNKSSGSFAQKLQIVFFEYTVLGICRLLDKPKYTKRKKTIPMNSIRSFPNLVCGEIKFECNKKISEIQTLAETLNDMRNRKIAHSNLMLKTKEAKPLEVARRIEVTETIARIHDILRTLCIYYCDSELLHTELGNMCAVETIFQLLRAEEYKKLDKEAKEQRDYWSYRINFPSWLETSNGRERYDLERILKVERK